MKLDQMLAILRRHPDCPGYLADYLELNGAAKSWPPNLAKKLYQLSFRNLAGRVMAHPDSTRELVNLLRNEVKRR